MSAHPSRPPRLSLAVQYAVQSQAAPARPQFRRWAKAALDCDAEVTLRIVDEAEGRALNREYRGKDYATNVLTFPLETEPLLIGDIVLCAPVVEREATEQGKTFEAHYAHLFIHGMLHLQGYDHETEDEAEEMERLETQLVTKFGYAAPYLVEQETN